MDANQLTSTQLHRICINLCELTDLWVGKHSDGLNSRDLLELVPNATKLQFITFMGTNIYINSEMYASLVGILQNRDDNTRLVIKVNEQSYKRVTYDQTHQDILLIRNDFCTYRPKNGVAFTLVDFH